MPAQRLEKIGIIDRSEPIIFQFDGKEYQGFKGDTLASALLANGVVLCGRSFKYHRPRGVVCEGCAEPNALVSIGEGARAEPNTRATMVEIYSGLVARSQNRFPSLRFDVSALVGFASWLFPSGFYYKTFMWPKSFWMHYEWVIRRMAGLGDAAKVDDPDHYCSQYAYCDVLVVGAGPSGIVAALQCAKSGARVILVDENATLGGAMGKQPATLDDQSGDEYIDDLSAQLQAHGDQVTILPRTTATGYYDNNYLSAIERVSDHLPMSARGNLPRQRLWKIRAKQVILATGAIERPLVFANNDRPGVMLADALMTYLRKYAVLPASDIVVFCNNDGAYQVAFEASQAGAKLSIVDPRMQIDPNLNGLARVYNITLYNGCVVADVGGSRSVKSVAIARYNADSGTVGKVIANIDAGVVAMSGGWSPTVHLFSQARGKLRFDDRHTHFVADKPIANCQIIGSANGEYEMNACFRDGIDGAARALDNLGMGGADIPIFTLPRIENPGFVSTPMALWQVPNLRGAKAFVDFQNDVTSKDIALAHREGYESVEHLKRYTTTGMGTDQGKTSNVNALALMATARGLSIGESGTTTFRPPYTPQSFGALAGANVGPRFMQERTTPMHDFHVAHNCVFEDVGEWKRPRYFPIGAETMDEAVNRECLAARSNVGLLDATTLGKIDIRGPDAKQLLNMVYTNPWNKLAIGNCRYGLMMNENGMVFDDGVTTCLGENHYHMTTTTGGAARVLSWLEEWLQTEWPQWQVYCTSVSEQWAVATLSGPNARAMLQPLCDISLSCEDFPFMSMRHATVCGVPARIFRISFTGELSFEINVPSRYAIQLWQGLLDAGAPIGLTQYGTEAMHVLRAEKGFIIVGQETDGMITPIDLGMGGMVSKTKDCLGKRSLLRSDLQRKDRRQLVGFIPVGHNQQLPEGAHLVSKLKDRPPMEIKGNITSSYYSANLGHPFGLALLEAGQICMGEEFFVPLLDGNAPKVKIVDPVFIDKPGVRMRG